jgi:hypothetical protein
MEWAIGESAIPTPALQIERSPLNQFQRVDQVAEAAPPRASARCRRRLKRSWSTSTPFASYNPRPVTLCPAERGCLKARPSWSRRR